MIPFSPSPALKLLLLLLAVVSAGVGGAWLGVEWESGQNAKRVMQAHEDREKAIADRIKLNARVNDRVSKDLNKGSKSREDKARDNRNSRGGKPNAQLVEVSCQQQPAGSPAASSPLNTDSPEGVPAPAAGSDDGARVRLSADGVREWNNALSLGATDSERAGWLAAADAGAGPVEIKDALQNLDDNAKLLGACRDREAGWISWAIEHGFMTP